MPIASSSVKRQRNLAHALVPTSAGPHHATEQLRQRRRVDANCRRTRFAGGQLEHSTVQSLVEQAQPVLLEPQYLEAPGAAAGEDEQGPAGRCVLSHPLPGHLRQPVEAVPHVHWLRADEDPDR